MIGRLLRWTGLTRPAFLIGIVLGLVSGAGCMLIAFPYLFPPAVINDSAPDMPLFDGRKAIEFRFDESAPGRDRLHWANGTGRIIPAQSGYTLRLNADFAAAPGPDYHIYLVDRPVRDKAEFLSVANPVEVARLRAFTSGQNYSLPPELSGKPVDLTNAHSVVIWCKFFKAYIGSAALMR